MATRNPPKRPRHGQRTQPDEAASLAGIGSLFVYDTLRELQRGQRALLASVHEIAHDVVALSENMAGMSAGEEAAFKAQLKIRAERLKAMAATPPI